MTKRVRTPKGFALPTVLISSVVMLIVLLAALTAISSINVGLRSQYYNQLAKEAAESGIARAQQCLQDNSFVAQWAATRPLQPNTNCSGVAQSGVANYVLETPIVRTTFKVEPPMQSGASQVIRATGTTELLRRSSGAVVRTYSAVTLGGTGSDLAVNAVTFGYNEQGAFFLTQAADGVLRGVGNNSYSQLSTGTSGSSLTPKTFVLPGGVRAASTYTSFLSGGKTVAVISTDGDAYVAGNNDYGQLGNASTASSQTARQFILPAGEKATFAATGGLNTFVLTDKYNIYGAGSCVAGMLGNGRTGNTESSCTEPRPVRVQLPTPVSGTSDAAKNTRPTSNITTDRRIVFVRMEGGAVYGWGDSYCGALAQNNNAIQTRPVKIGTYGDVNQPKAIDVRTDGTVVYILDDQGQVRAAGCNFVGQLGTEGTVLVNDRARLCLDNPGNDTSDAVRLWLYTCDRVTNNGDAQKWSFNVNGEIKNSRGVCIDLLNGNTSNGTAVQRYRCLNNANQKWVMTDDFRIRFAANQNKCIDVADPGTNSRDGLMLWDCLGNQPKQVWRPADEQVLRPLNMPVPGKVKQIATDQDYLSFIIDTNNDGQGDEVWGYGNNQIGQLGNGTTSLVNMAAVKFQLPSGVRPMSVVVSSRAGQDPPLFNNVFVTGSDGRVYGAGGNVSGQLGDGTTTNRSTPVVMQVINGTSIAASEVRVGRGTAVIYTTDNRVYTVGDNSSGQLGDGTTINSSIPRANKYTNIVPLQIF